MDMHTPLCVPPIVERIVRVRCWNCNEVIGTTENSIVGEEALLAAARKIRKCPLCGAVIGGEWKT